MRKTSRTDKIRLSYFPENEIEFLTAGWDDGWRAVNKKYWFDYQWDDVPIEIKTEIHIGSNEIIYFEVQDHDNQGMAKVEIKLDHDPHFFFQYCQEDKNLENLPAENRRIWTLKKYGLEGIAIECNGVEVGGLMFKDSVQPHNCDASKWTTKKVKRVNFVQNDATLAMRGK